MYWSDEIVRPDAPSAWLWPGLLAPGYTTLLRGPCGSGKTTLMHRLLARRSTGGTLLDRPVLAELLARWPVDRPRPHTGTLWRWLDAACALQLLARHGAGTPGEPFRYDLPANGADRRGHGR